MIVKQRDHRSVLLQAACHNLVDNVKMGFKLCILGQLPSQDTGYCIISDRKYQELRQINTELWMLNFTIQH